MTREEAIEQLQNCKGLILQDNKDWLDERDIPLIDMAISALSAEGIYGRPTTKDTLISREELNNALAQYVVDGYAESADDYKAYCDIIDNLPNRFTEYETFCGVDMEEAIEVMTKYNEKQTEPSDLISKAELIDAIEDTDWYHINRNGKMVHGSNDEYESWYKYEDIYKAIAEVPSVSAERVGEWQRKLVHYTDGSHGYRLKCSVCEEEWLSETNYCPNCGARMENKK